MVCRILEAVGAKRIISSPRNQLGFLNGKTPIKKKNHKALWRGTHRIIQNFPLKRWERQALSQLGRKSGSSLMLAMSRGDGVTTKIKYRDATCGRHTNTMYWFWQWYPFLLYCIYLFIYFNVRKPASWKTIDSLGLKLNWKLVGPVDLLLNSVALCLFWGLTPSWRDESAWKPRLQLAKLSQQFQGNRSLDEVESFLFHLSGEK